jgi:RNA polymerase sigma factor (sigma-70 family)
MASVLGYRVGSRRLAEHDDERLATLVRSGDEAAFEALYERHHASLLAFCRHMLGNREDGEDALQQTFVRAHRALGAGPTPDAVRPWLFAIARNRCRTMLAARREGAVTIDDVGRGFDGLAEDVRRRADLRELVADLGRLPDDQREALVLFELGDLSHTEIAATIGCPPGKVKALVFQARTALIAERDARGTPCEEIRDQLEVARGGVLRRGSLRRHLRQCDPCRAYRVAVTRQRAKLACVLPVVPTAGLKAAVLAGAGVSGGAGTSAAAAAAGEALSPGAAAATGGIAVKGLVAKAAIAVALGAGASGAVTAIDDGSTRDPATAHAARPAAGTSSVEPRPASARNEQARRPSGARSLKGTAAVRRRARAASIQRRRSSARTLCGAARRARRAEVVSRRAIRLRRRVQNATLRTVPANTQSLRRRPAGSPLRKRRQVRSGSAVRRAVPAAVVRRRPARGRPGARRAARQPNRLRQGRRASAGSTAR